ncbi:MAG: amine oxidoreductase [Deltaproteobacteria bacterium]|nr:amine oxidoreductase [Deltaproteobacteria bacterium]
MQHYKYVILGAGPSGLSFAHTLKSLGEDSFLVIEKESVAGGLCRSETVDGAPLDIGGGHFLDVKRQEALNLLFRFLPRSEWREYSRISKIKIRQMEIDYPLEANLWQLSASDQIDFLESIAQAGCVGGLPMPESFEKWISWKLGARIAEEYMLPYNRKIWSIPLDELGIYWLYKLPDVSFRETLQSCLESKPAGRIPAHGNFFYPKHYGYGEVWRRMGVALGERLRASTTVTGIDVKNRVVNGCVRAEQIVSTIPWTSWPAIADVPGPIIDAISRLRNASIDVDYFPESLPTKAHWIYDPDERIAHHRVLCRSNFCEGSQGYWTETNSKRAIDAKGYRHRNEYAYPLNTIKKPEAVAIVCDWASQNRITGLGRWGTWEHMNSDTAVSEGIREAKKSWEAGKNPR